jgi:hypothetical protein
VTLRRSGRRAAASEFNNIEKPPRDPVPAPRPLENLVLALDLPRRKPARGKSALIMNLERLWTLNRPVCHVKNSRSTRISNRIGQNR